MSLATERMPLHLAHELIVYRAAQPLIEWYGRGKTGLRHAARHEICVLTKLLHADCAHGELPA